MKKNKKAIVVVESFLVMTLLGMISFFSLQGYSIEAMNAKVSSDLTIIKRGIETKVAEGGNLLSFVTNNKKNRLTNLSLGGKKATEENYFVGTPNYTALGIKRDEFLDPSGNDYVIGVTTTGGGRMEISGVIEIGGKKQSIIKGSYTGRDNQKYVIDSISGKVIVLNSSAMNAFKNGDYVKIGPVKYNVERVKRDGITIVLDKEVIGNLTKISLVENEGSGLISDYRYKTITVESGSNVAVPY